MRRGIIACVMGGLLFGMVAGVSAETLRVGLTLPMSGWNALGGDQCFKGAKLALEEIGAAKSLGPIQIEYFLADDVCEPAPATKAAEKLILRDKVDVLVGGTCSSAAEALSMSARKYKIPFVVIQSGATDLTEKGHEYLVRIVPNNRQANVSLADLVLRRFKGAPVATIYPLNDWGIDCDDIFSKEIQRRGGNIVSRLGVQAPEVNFYSSLTKLKELKPGVVFFSTYGAAVPSMLRQANEIGFQTTWITLYQPIFEDQAGKFAHGVIRGTYFHPKASNPKSIDFQKKIKTKFNAEPTNYFASAYDGIYVVADALKRGGAKKEGFLKALRETKKVQGVMGEITFDEKGQTLAKDRITFIKLREGAPEVIE